MIKLTRIQSHMDGTTWEQPVRVNARQIIHYHDEHIGLDDRRVTRISTIAFEDLFVTETLDEIDLLIGG